MAKHEMKRCPRCGERFECKCGSISLCQCQRVALDEAQVAFIEARYDDCLCAECLAALRSMFNVCQFNERINALRHESEGCIPGRNNPVSCLPVCGG